MTDCQGISYMYVLYNVPVQQYEVAAVQYIVYTLQRQPIKYILQSVLYNFNQ